MFEVFTNKCKTLFFFKQYKSHDVTDWIGKNERFNALNGFAFRSGRMPETSGIWTWSEVFTHDFDNGDKVAIILLDTQGTFDLQSSMRDCATVFAISTLLSSMQCFNLFHNIQEDDLNSLELFTEYATLAQQQTNTTPFQYLLFIVRDWSDPDIDYGWSSQIINEIFAETPQQTLEMRSLRNKIRSSFQEIGSFLMPFPGLKVARSKNFTGHLQDIDPLFVEYLEMLVHGLLAPENLVVKQINGEKIKAQDFSKYLVEYMKVFTGDQLPPPMTVLEVRQFLMSSNAAFNLPNCE